MNKNKITLFNIISTVILQGLAFFSGPIFSSILGPNNYGIVAVYNTWVQLASTVFSLQAAGTIVLARANFPTEDQEKYQSSVLSLATTVYAFFSFITIFILFIALGKLNVSIPMLFLGLVHGWGMYCISFMNSKFTYEFKADKNFMLSVSISVLTISISLFLVNIYPAKINYWGRIIGQSSVYIIMGLSMFIYVLARGKTFYNKQYWIFTLPIAIPTVFHSLAGIVLNQSDKVMLQSMVSNSSAGIYALACTFGTLLNTIWGALNNSWVPFYYEYTRQGQVQEMKKHAQNYIELFTTVAIGFILLSREVFHLYAKQSFWEGTDLIPLFAVGYYFVFLYSFPVNYEFYNKKTKTIAVGTISAAICNVILNYLFIQQWGILGAVIATALAHSLQFGFHYICAKKINSGDFPFKLVEFVPGSLSICVTCIIYMITKDLWYLRWGLGALLGLRLLIKIIKRKEIF